MMRILVFLILFSSLAWAKQPVEQRHVIEHYHYEQYTGDNEGLNGLIGYYYDYFWNPEIFVSVGTSWAVSGNHGGYGVATIGLGYQKWISPNWSWDIVYRVGAGGHFSISAGGGLMTTVDIGTQYYLWDPFGIELRVGNLDYPNGDYGVGVVSIGFVTHYSILGGHR